jgi:aminoglycoside phosphotransferase (APT) family kinase protein
LVAEYIVHGDSHQGNSYLRPDGTRIRIDWQLVRKGRPWRDLTYFMVGALTIEERRASERQLLKHYREALVATGAQDVASDEDIWDSYRHWPIYGCQAWLANMDEWGQTGYPMNERFFTALQDLDTVRLLNGVVVSVSSW